MTGRYHIETWGCQMNVHDSEKLSGALERDGYVRARAAAEADVILLNTCAIREKASEKVFSELGRLKPYKQANPGLVIGVCGCVAQLVADEILRRAPHVDFVVGPRASGSMTETLRNLRSGRTADLRRIDTEYRRDSIEFPFEGIRRIGECPSKAFVTVIEGCNHRCTYCVVPQTRGREICREQEEILAEVRSLASNGVLEVEFLGQTVNAYRDTQGNTLAELLLATAEIDGIRRIRFTTSHPAQMTDRLMDAMAAAGPKVAPYLHLPVQSGSSSVLRRMRRGYDREGYLSKIDGLRRRIHGLALGSDVIVGFCGETEQEFEDTLSLLDQVQYDTLYSFAYSTRPRTAALELGDSVPEALKFERLHRLQAHQKTIQERKNRAWIGQEVEVLVEGRSKRDASRWTGRTPEYRVVHFTGDSAPGRIERVRIREATAFSLSAEPLPVLLDRSPTPYTMATQGPTKER